MAIIKSRSNKSNKSEVIDDNIFNIKLKHQICAATSRKALVCNKGSYLRPLKQISTMVEIVRNFFIEIIRSIENNITHSMYG